MPRYRRPIWSALAVGMPLSGVAAAVVLYLVIGTGGGGHGGMAAVLLGMVLTLIGMALGAVATIAAVLRKERWVPAQVAGFALNFGIGVPILIHILPDLVRLR